MTEHKQHIEEELDPHLRELEEEDDVDFYKKPPVNPVKQLVSNMLESLFWSIVLFVTAVISAGIVYAISPDTVSKVGGAINLLIQAGLAKL